MIGQLGSDSFYCHKGSIKIKDAEAQAYISKIETIGLPYEDMQMQYQHLLQQMTERDDYNIKDSKQQIEASNKEKEEMLAKLAQADKTAVEWKNRVTKLEEDNAKLRRALEQSMTRLNRMSVDSDFLVDRSCILWSACLDFQMTISSSE